MTRRVHIGRRGLRWASALACVGAAWLGGCLEPLEVDDTAPPEVAEGETRRVELTATAFEIEGYEVRLTADDLRELPQRTRDRLWLLDLDLSSGPASPRLVENALEAIAASDPDALDGAARNMQRLLVMTPDTADLTGTSFEPLTELAPLVGVSPAAALADLLGLNVEDPFLDRQAIADAIVFELMGSHPAAQFRPGPVTPDHPDGLYPVTPGALPITLSDALTDFATLADRFGEVDAGGAYHPGFAVAPTRATLLDDDFALTVRVNGNAAPFRGVDLTDASVASVTSLGGRAATLFDFDDPDWLRIEGLPPGTPVIDEMTIRIVEDGVWHDGGRSPMPPGQGDSTAWRLPSYTLEYLVLRASRDTWAGWSSEVAYTLPDRDDPSFVLEVVDGWTTVTTDGGLGDPPAPAYVWDLLLEAAQVRLHDGGIAEGDAVVEITFTDIPVGLDGATIERTLRENLEADPAALGEVAAQVIDQTRGAADLFYVQDDAGADWLVFVAEADLALDAAGLPVRPYTYASPGFFADAELTTPASTEQTVSGAPRQAVTVVAGDTVFVADDAGAVYQIDVADKPGRSTIALDVTRRR